MLFSNTTTQSGLIQDCETLTGIGKNGISGNTDKLKEFTRLMNVWYRKADSWIWDAVGDWDFDDGNYTTLPVGTTDLVAGQHDYSVPSSARKIERVEAIDEDGDYSILTPIDKSEIQSEGMSRFEDEDSFPLYYDMVGGSIYLYPAPKDNATSGLKLYCSRDINEFSTTFNATTSAVTPGFDNHFHRILSLGASYDWCVAKGLAKSPVLRAELSQLEGEIKSFYGSRNRNFKTKFRIIEDRSI